jgi:hypothetical protein
MSPSSLEGCRLSNVVVSVECMSNWESLPPHSYGLSVAVQQSHENITTTSHNTPRLQMIDVDVAVVCQEPIQQNSLVFFPRREEISTSEWS